ncbi:methionyl aminopeptidase [Plasmodium inui San Antonio 1]|uniref:Methionyl aminopeptidase n=1 Tax=Plasmodium inui San Antonio 1 TaxID=1237626 RepID=W7A4G2_9APIC|nr:methionyl aminopeptidase [Plasmodium inui San Antonio 1]EUD66580.1 methionyl aminopeptidase [Plasmodium inui San Antonio 1]
MKTRTLVLLTWAFLFLCRRGGRIGRVRSVRSVRRVSRVRWVSRGSCTGCGGLARRGPRRGFLPVEKNSKGSYIKESSPRWRHPQKRSHLNSASGGEGFSNTIHHDVKKNTQNYSEDGPPASFHRYIENMKTRKNVHPSIRITEFDKKFMRCKESYNGRYSHLKDSDLFGNFRFIGRQKKGIMSPKYYLPKYVERPNYHRTGTPVYVPYEGEGQISGSGKGSESAKHPYSNIKSEEDIETIRSNCLFARELMDDVSHIICEGVTTNDLDIYILNKCINNGYYPSPLNYHLFPKSSCISINEILCHGIPDNNVLYENDIVKVDISVFKDGFHADMCESFLLRTKYTKFILKYNFDLTTNKVVKTGKQCSIRKIRYDPPNSKDRPTEQYQSYDDNTNAVLRSGEFQGEAVTHDEGYYNAGGSFPTDEAANGAANLSRDDLSGDYLDELELFHRQYDEQVIYNKQQNSQTYDDIQSYIYRKTRGPQNDQNRFAFFDKRKLDVDEFKTYMHKKNMDLIRTAHECTMEAIRVCKPGVPFSAIGDAIVDHLERKNNHNTHYAVVPHLCGHNIGKNFHEEPFIIHTRNDDKRLMCENLVFTIEPIISERPCDFIMWPDNWTLSNARYVFSAQFEHTIVVRKDGAEILTGKTERSPKFVWECEAA